MRRFARFAAAIAALAVAASCARPPDYIQPGEWELRTTLTDFDAPGAPPATTAYAREELNQERTMRACITPEQAANPLRDARGGLGLIPASATCTTGEDSFSGGVIRVRLSCRGNGELQQGEATITSDGSFSETTIRTTSTITAQGTDPSGAQRMMRINTRMRGIRIGDCPGSSARPRNTR